MTQPDEIDVCLECFHILPRDGTCVLCDLLPAHATRVVVYLQPVNMGWGPTKLRDICTESLGFVPDGSTVFLFTNKSRDSLLLYWLDEEGDQTLLKKLNQGGFLLPAPKNEGEPFVVMKPTVLASLFR